MSSENFPPTSEGLHTPVEPLSFRLSLKNGSGEVISGVRYQEEAGVVMATPGVEGPQTIDPQPMGALKIGKLDFPVVGRIAYTEKKLEGDRSVDVAIIDLRAYAPQLKEYDKVRVGPYWYRPKSSSDDTAPGLRPAPFALVDIRSLRESGPTADKPQRHLSPLSMCNNRQNKLDIDGFGSSVGMRLDFFTYSSRPVYKDIALVVDDKDRIIVKGGSSTAGKFTLLTATPVSPDYQPEFTATERARNDRTASLGALSLKDLFGSSVWVAGKSEKIGALDTPPPPYVAEIDTRVAGMLAKGMPPERVRRGLARHYHPDRDGGSHEALAYLNGKIDGLLKEQGQFHSTGEHFSNRP